MQFPQVLLVIIIMSMCHSCKLKHEIHGQTEVIPGSLDTPSKSVKSLDCPGHSWTVGNYELVQPTTTYGFLRSYECLCVCCSSVTLSYILSSMLAHNPRLGHLLVPQTLACAH